MAKISAHGRIVGTVYLLTSAKRYMSDGVVLKNFGFGWKLHLKLRYGISPEIVFANASARHLEGLAKRPRYSAYRAMLHDMAGMSLRWKLHAAVTLMPDDCDGVWSEACDGDGDNCSASVDEVGELCHLYRLALKEQAELHAIVPAAYRLRISPASAGRLAAAVDDGELVGGTPADQGAAAVMGATQIGNCRKEGTANE